MGAPAWKKINKSGRWVGLQIRDTSDGDQKSWPSCPPYRPSDDENYLIQLGEEWGKNGEPGVNHYILRLPDNYAVFETKQPGGDQVYKRLFGHPKGRFYDSIQKFKPHFLWLMSGMEGDCRCHLCSGKPQGPRIPREKRQPREVSDRSISLPSRSARSSTRYDDTDSANGLAGRRARRDAKQTHGAYAVDEEGTDDVFKRFIKLLYTSRDSARGIDEDIEEVSSLDWCAEHYEDGSNLMPQHLAQFDRRHSCLPRLGEVVLWCTNFPDGHRLLLDHKTAQYKFYSHTQRSFNGHPVWRAGVVTCTPLSGPENPPGDFQTVLDAADKEMALNAVGYRVETLPDPNDLLKKSTSKQYRWLSLECIRPLSQWQMMTHGIPRQKLHPSIMHALTCSTSLSLIEKFKATGLWPNAAIHCKGLYLGPELIMGGDTVRLSPQQSDECEDVLRIESIRLNLDNIRQEHTEPNSQDIASGCRISIVGTACTSNVDRAYSMPPRGHLVEGFESPDQRSPISLSEMKTALRAVRAAEYGSWYYLHDPKKRYEVSHEQILGRLHETAAVQLWKDVEAESQVRAQSQLQKLSLNFDISGISLARVIASCTDTRLPLQEGHEILWYWADTRAEALGVESFNGHEVGKYWRVRDKETLGSWHTQMRIINGTPITVSEASNYVPLSSIPSSGRGRKPGTRLVNGKVVGPSHPDYDAASRTTARPKPTSQMAGAALASTDEGESGNDDDETDQDEDRGISINDEAAELVKWQAVAGEQGVEIYQPVDSESREISSSRPEVVQQPDDRTKAPATKRQIMANASGFDVEEEHWYDDPVPLARGGTDESSGGDYSSRGDRSESGSEQL